MNSVSNAFRLGGRELFHSRARTYRATDSEQGSLDAIARTAGHATITRWLRSLAQAHLVRDTSPEHQ